MAHATRFVCRNCQNELVSWSDGNPYYWDETGTKKYAYHPDHVRLDRCVGNDSPHLCLGCGAELLVDSAAPTSICTKCGAERLVDTQSLEGLICPLCRVGTFQVDPEFDAIS